MHTHIRKTDEDGLIIWGRWTKARAGIGVDFHVWPWSPHGLKPPGVGSADDRPPTELGQGELLQMRM
eukprot:1189200-Prorocentrum_minimum.AAC.4